MKGDAVVSEEMAPVIPTMTLTAKAVLDAALGARASLRSLANKEWVGWQYILSQYPLLGRAPNPREIADALREKTVGGVQAVLEKLNSLDCLYLDQERHEIRYAYPFSSFPTKHVVTFLNWSEAKPVYAMCAVDALGIPFMVHRDVAITSSCPQCGRPITIEVRNRRIASYAPAEVVVWMTSDRTECAAASVCPTLNYFCSPAHVEAWRSSHSKTPGCVLHLAEALFVAKGLFEDLLLSPPVNMEAPETGASARRPEKTVTTVATTGGLLAAFLASLCCVGPLVLAALGVGVGATGILASTAGFLKGLLPYRPFFIGLTALVLGVAFYQAYRKPRSACAPGATCVPATSQRKARVVLWAVAALALALILAPYWLGL